MSSVLHGPCRCSLPDGLRSVLLSYVSVSGPQVLSLAPRGGQRGAGVALEAEGQKSILSAARGAALRLSLGPCEAACAAFEGTGRGLAGVRGGKHLRRFQETHPGFRSARPLGRAQSVTRFRGVVGDGWGWGPEGGGFRVQAPFAGSRMAALGFACAHLMGHHCARADLSLSRRELGGGRCRGAVLPLHF